MTALRDLILILLNIYFWIIIIQVILSWLIAFGVINTSNEIVRTIGRFVETLTEPVMGPIRRFLPSMGGIDLSPMIVLLAIFFIERLIVTNWPVAAPA